MTRIIPLYDQSPEGPTRRRAETCLGVGPATFRSRSPQAAAPVVAPTVPPVRVVAPVAAPRSAVASRPSGASRPEMQPHPVPGSEAPTVRRLDNRLWSRSAPTKGDTVAYRNIDGHPPVIVLRTLIQGMSPAAPPAPPTQPRAQDPFSPRFSPLQPSAPVVSNAPTAGLTVALLVAVVVLLLALTIMAAVVLSRHAG